MYCKKITKTLSLALASVMILGAFALTGCQSSIGGQTLPSAHYLRDDIQYFPKGPEFKLQNEANALRTQRINAQANR